MFLLSAHAQAGTVELRLPAGGARTLSAVQLEAGEAEALTGRLGAGVGELAYSLSPEVPGLSFDPATRELTGTPSEAGVHLMTYRVRDASGDTDWRYFNIAVEAAPDGGTGTQPDDYTPLAGLRVSADLIQYGIFSIPNCLPLSNITLNGVTYTAHSSKWQRRDGADSP